MLIVGAKGFAKEVLEVLYQINGLEDVSFYDDVSTDLPDKLFGQFKVVRTLEEAAALFEKDKRFTLGVGGPVLRYKLFQKFTAIGGEFASTISNKTDIGHFGNQIGNGCNIMTGTIITNDVTFGQGCLINLNCTIGHDCLIGDFVEMSPGVNVSGNCKIGSFSNLGTNSILLPKITIGKNVIVGAGAVVTKDVPDNSLVVGMPAMIKKELPPLEF